jgi:predicted phage terminase large subunit-like protein
MGSLELTTTACLPNSPGAAQYAGSLRMTETPPLRGKSESWLWTTATQLGEFGLFCATHATSWLKSATRQPYCARPLNTLSITLDEIASITPDGVEDVYDIQVEGTESFLANGVVSHNTRWHQRDLIGRLLKDSALNDGGDKYESFEFPAILHEGTENEKSIWPEQWTLEALQKTRASMHHIMWQWFAQYQQNPTASEAAIIKRDWIKWWTKEDPPPCEFIVQAFDTALTTKDRSDFSVCHTWGVFTNDADNSSNVILLNKVKGKYEFPELKVMAHDQYKDWDPDSVIVEAKASGQPLIDEMRRSGIFVQDFSPGKGQDKIARLNAVSDMFAAGHVWFPETAWASATVEEILAFPAGEHDDEVDAMTLALARVRKGGLLRLNTDREDNEPIMRPRRGAYY